MHGAWKRKISTRCSLGRTV